MSTRKSLRSASKHDGKDSAGASDASSTAVTAATANNSNKRSASAAASSSASEYNNNKMMSDDGFEFTKKQKGSKGKAVPIAAESSSSSSAVNAASSSSSSSSSRSSKPASSSSSSEPSIPHRSYPSSHAATAVFPFDPSVHSTLSSAATALFESILAHEHEIVEKHYTSESSSSSSKNKKGGSKSSKSKENESSSSSSSSSVSPATQYKFLLDALSAVRSEFLTALKADKHVELARTLVSSDPSFTSGNNSSTVKLIENPRNASLRDEKERWERMTETVKQDVMAWKKLMEGLKVKLANVAAAPVPHDEVAVGGSSSSSSASSSASAAGLSPEDRAFLSSLPHHGGALTTAISDTYRRMAVKGQASLHTLEELERWVSEVSEMQSVATQKFDEADKKTYGKMVDDPRALIQMITGGATAAAVGATTTAVPAADSSSSSSAAMQQ